MQIQISAIVAFLMSSVIVPAFERSAIPLTSAQQAKLGDWITAALMLVITLATHLVHSKIKTVRAAKVAARAAAIAANAPVPPPQSATTVGTFRSGAKL